MPSISDRLKSLGVSVGTQNLKSPKPGLDEEYPIEKVLAGDFRHTLLGDTFVVETNYKADFLQGTIKLKPSASLEVIAAYARAPEIAELDIEKFAFMDTETTGLGLGTGVYTFMVGIGRFEGEHFQLAQFFLREPGEEMAQLAAIEEFLAPCEVWVSFNGKSFDIPLLNNRYIINGWPVPLKDAPHIDLLHLARRLWKARLPSRTLGDLEAKILGATRTQQDVPGWMVADLYFDYLHTRDARPLLGVFYHNEMDVISLAALLAHMADQLADPLNGSVENGLDLLAIGKLYADLGQLETAAQIYQRGLEYGDLQKEAYWQALRELSFIHKKQENIKTACHLWEQAAQANQIYAHVELAKVFEHRQKDYGTASYWTQAAIEIVTADEFPVFERQQVLPELEHRLARLERKSTTNQKISKTNDDHSPPN
jgi:uncharacterized protein YprB with RNaseH-like and TPR domain